MILVAGLWPFNFWAKNGVIDCFGILKDDKIRRYFELGCEVKGLGCGNVKRIKDQVQAKSEEVMLKRKL